MIFAGIDMGAKMIKVVLIKDGRIVAKSKITGGFDEKESAREALKKAVDQLSVGFEDLGAVVSTGVGRKLVDIATFSVTDVTADAKGAVFLYPSVRTVIDVGAEEGRAIRCDASGRVIDFAVNEKCAAGAGSFVEAMARAVEMELNEFAAASLKSNKEIPMNAQCAVFAESEVVSLIHSGTSKEDISKAVHDAMASRVTAMVRRVGVERDLAFIGGVAKNPGFVQSLKRSLGIENIIIPEDPDFVGAIGAALIGSEGRIREE